MVSRCPNLATWFTWASTYAKNYNDAAKATHQEVNKFDTLFQPNQTPDQFFQNLTTLEKTIKVSIENLEAAAKAAEQKKNSLGIWGFALTDNKMVVVNILSNLSTWCAFLGGVVQSAVPDDYQAYKQGFGVPLLALGGFFSTVLMTYSNAIFLINGEKSDLQDLSTSNQKDAETFLKFLAAYKEIKQQQLDEQEKEKKNQETHKDEVIKVLTDEIKQLRETNSKLEAAIIRCLEKYDALPTAYKTDVIQEKIISNVIMDLPEDNKTKNAVLELKKGANTSDPNNRTEWKSEKETINGQKNVSKKKKEYKKCFNDLTNEIKERWGLSLKKIEKVYDFAKGHLIDSTGIKQIPNEG